MAERLQAQRLLTLEHRHCHLAACFATHNEAPHPTSRKTPMGGTKIAKMILMMSEQVKGILSEFELRLLVLVLCVLLEAKQSSVRA